MTNKENGLLPCPFGGCEAKCEKRNVYTGTGGLGDYDVHVYGCPKHKIYFDTLEQWNTRDNEDTFGHKHNDISIKNQNAKAYYTPFPSAQPPHNGVVDYQFDRYENGTKMAEGATVKADNIKEAAEKAVRLFLDRPQSIFVLLSHPKQSEGVGDVDKLKQEIVKEYGLLAYEIDGANIAVNHLYKMGYLKTLTAQPNAVDVPRYDPKLGLIQKEPINVELLAAAKHARGCVPFPSDCHTKLVLAIHRAEAGRKGGE